MALFYYQEKNTLSKFFLIFKFVLSLGNKTDNWKISLKKEATNSLLVLVVI